MRVAVIGCGYVGLISAVILTKEGHKVCAIDSSAYVVQKIRQGVPPFFEPNLRERLDEALDRGFRISETFPDEDFDVYMLTVGTPTVNGVQDLGQIKQALKLITNHLAPRENFAAIVIKSTVAPGTTNMLEKVVAEALPRGRFGMCMNPEFLREGNAVEDAELPDRIVLGSSSEQAIDLLQKMYQNSKCRKFIVSPTTAEMVKYMNNALLASLISFSNEMSNIASTNLDINYIDALGIVLSDKRWQCKDDGSSVPSVASYLKPGPGYGGSCFPKDVQALTSYAQEKGVSVPILEAIEKVNSEQAVKVLKPLVDKILAGEVLRVLVLGLSFKENTSDVRGSVSYPIIRHLLEVGADVRAHDPIAAEEFCKEYSFNSEIIIKDWRSGLQWSQAIVLVTPWSDYIELGETNFYKGFLLDPRSALLR